MVNNHRSREAASEIKTNTKDMKADHRMTNHEVDMETKTETGGKEKASQAGNHNCKKGIYTMIQCREDMGDYHANR